MATREMRIRGSAMRTALFAMAVLFLVPLLGIDGASGTAVTRAAEDRGARAVAFGPYAERATHS
ncbi:MAG: hypothetical protein WCD21_23660, partial [Streptomyces sp.]